MTKKSHYNKELKPLARKLRNESTLGEILLWDSVLKQKKLDYQFVRQFAIGDYILDFACRKLKLGIEIDGYTHNFTIDRDIAKDEYLNSVGYRVVRFEEKEVRHDIDNVIRVLEGTINELENSK